MESLLTPEKGLIIWTVVTFAILLVVLGRFGWGPLIQSINDREAGIRKAIEDAASAKQSAEQLKAQLEKELAASQSRAQAMIADAQADAQKLREKLMKDAEADAQRLSEQTRRQLEEEKSRLSRELRGEAARLSIQVAEKLLRHTVNAKEQETLVQNILKDIETKSPSR